MGRSTARCPMTIRGGGKAAPSSSEISIPARTTIGRRLAIIASDIRSLGPRMLTEARMWPLAANTGALIEATPSDCSSRLTAYPRLRASTTCISSSTTSVIVAAVIGIRVSPLSRS